MALQESERLRQLVSDYYHGRTTLESYRQQRAQLLDNIGAGTVEQSAETTNRKPPPPVQLPPPSAAVPIEPEVTGSSFGPKQLAVGATAVVAIAAIAFVVSTQMPDSAMAPDSQLERSGPDSDSAVEPGDELIDEFLSRNDWTDDSLGNFLLAWGALDDGQRQLVTEGRRYRRLTTSLHQRIREEAALSDSANSDRLESLADFAATMGAPYRKFTAGESEKRTESAIVASGDAQKSPIVVATDTDDNVAQPDEKIDAASDSSLPASPPEEKVDERAADETAETTDVTADHEEVTPEPNNESVEESSSVSATAAAVDDPCPARIASTRRPYCQDSLADGSTGPPLVVLPTGTFEMGSSAVESEAPPHRVAIEYHIAMSIFEVTAEEYSAFCTAKMLPCTDAALDDDYPVVSISWDDATAYAEWLSESTRFQYRLPSEAEWEFAARAGTQSPYFFGDDITPSAAHSSENGPLDAPVLRTDRTINRNPFRLYHMSGNVREWTQDAWYPNYANAPVDGSARRREAEVLRVVRGGSYADRSREATVVRARAAGALASRRRDGISRCPRGVLDKRLKTKLNWSFRLMLLKCFHK